MTIEYALTRTEIVQGFFRSLASSPKYLLTILLYALTMNYIVLESRGAFSARLTHGCEKRRLIGTRILHLLASQLFIRGKTTRRL